ncbi:hypothetical protein EHS39_23825 [Ensifer sp. MPMI2T]|nr:hypothetical protein EHS39_23825 [Ensifer sp. MPMI2T]
MKLTLKSILDAGNDVKERIVLSVLENADVGDFLLTRNLASGADVGLHVQNTFWFPYKEVEAGDIVVLYTRNGIATEKKNANGTTSHFFYWGLDDSIWKEDDVMPVLFQAPDWQSRSAASLRVRKLKA